MTSLVTTPPPVLTAATARPRRRSRARSPYLYILPAMILVVGVIYAGMGYTGYVSMLEWNGLSPNPTFVGFDNFARISEDPIFWTAVRNVLIFAVITIFTQIFLGLLMAALIQDQLVVGRSILKVILFLPVVLAPAIVATSFRELLTPDGAVNGALEAIGLGSLTQAWLADPHYALYAIALINVWQWTGFSFILYQASLGQIEASQYEAAQMDGAGPVRIMRSIIFPQLRGTHFTLMVIGLIGSLKTFDIVFLTTAGGPGRATEFLTTYIYKQAISQFHAGYSAALSIVLLVLSLAFTVSQMRLARKLED